MKPVDDAGLAASGRRRGLPRAAVVLARLGLVLSAPLMLLAAAAIRLTSRGPVITTTSARRSWRRGVRAVGWTMRAVWSGRVGTAVVAKDHA